MAYNSFLRAVLTNPKLAEHIEEVNMLDVSQYDPHEISQEDVQLFQKAVADSPLPVQLKDSLKNGIKEGMACCQACAFAMQPAEPEDCVHVKA